MLAVDLKAQVYKEKYPTIICTDTHEDNFVPTSRIKTLEFAFDKFFLKFQDVKGVAGEWLIVLKNGIESGTAYLVDKNMVSSKYFYHWNNFFDVSIGRENDIKAFLKDGKKEKVIKEIEYIHNFTMYFIEYIMTHGGEKKLKDKPNVKENKEQNGKKKRKKKNSRQTIYLLEEIVEYANSGIGKHEVTCPCWQVRGHYRHYKNGKTVFIKSFYKGKRRETQDCIPNTYKV